MDNPRPNTALEETARQRRYAALRSCDAAPTQNQQRTQTVCSTTRWYLSLPANPAPNPDVRRASRRTLGAVPARRLAPRQISPEIEGSG
jgi:hypothetical protein